MSSDNGGGGFGLGWIIIILMLISAFGGNDDEKKKPKDTETKVQVEETQSSATKEQVEKKIDEVLEKAKRAVSAAKQEFRKGDWAACVDACKGASDIHSCRDDCQAGKSTDKYFNKSEDKTAKPAEKPKAAKKTEPRVTKSDSETYDYNEWEDSR